MSKQVQLIIALAMAVVGVFGVHRYVEIEREAMSPGKRVRVAIAKKDIQPGTQLRPNMVRFEDVPQTFAPKVALTESDIDAFNGLELSVPVRAKDYILDTYFSLRRSVGNKLSDQVVGENFRAVTLPVDQTDSLSGSIVTGDRIDLLFSFNIPEVAGKMSTVLLQNVQVIATGTYSAADQEIGPRTGRGARYNSLTLLLNAEDAMRLNYARQSGQIDILLRNSADSANVDLQPISGVGDLLSASEKETVAALLKQGQLSDEERERLRNQLKELFQSQRQQQQLRNR